MKDRFAATHKGFRLRYDAPDQAQSVHYLELAGKLNIPYPIAVLLGQRGISTPAEAAGFLDPKLADLPSPFLLKGMERAVALVIRALVEQWPICIHGDYDVDGISGSALLARFFRQLGASPLCYQPDWLSEGYGLQTGFILKNAPEKGKNGLLITVDCGVSATQEVRIAREAGFTVIVTDHHEPPPQLPAAHALVNPKQQGCPFPFKELAGAGVAFFLAVGIRRELVGQAIIKSGDAPNLKELTDLVALGTVADVVPLTGINRILTRAGLEIMNDRPRPWVSALKRLNSQLEGPLRAEDIAYRIAPRLNAPGRLGRPESSFELLTCEDQEQAFQLACSLEQSNQERRRIETELLEQVMDECSRQHAAGASGLIVHGQFHAGVIGIIASRAVDRFGKPVLILTEDPADSSVFKGSGRSVEQVNLFEVLTECADILLQFGGHAMAAGLTVSKQNLPIFRERFTLVVSSVSQAAPQTGRETLVDCCLPAEEVLDRMFLAVYRQLEPFGNGNPEPVFLLDRAQVNNPGAVKNHLKYSVRINGSEYHGIGFNLADRLNMFESGSGVRLAVTIKSTVYRGVARVELHTREVASIEDYRAP